MERKHMYDLAGAPQRKVYCVMDRYYETREEAQAAVDAICDAGYGIPEIEEYYIDANFRSGEPFKFI